MAIPPHLTDYWNAFIAATGVAGEGRFYEAFSFGDSEELAEELATLALQGVKTATASLVRFLEAEGKRLPQQGDLSIVTSWSGNPLCIIETQSVDVVPFNEVTAEFAALEGEGDLCLAVSREGHERCFTRECDRAGGSLARVC